MPSIRKYDYDILVLGAGVAGLGVATSLAGKGARVAVLEHGGLRGAASPRAAGILDPFLGLDAGHPMIPLTLAAFKRFPSWVDRLEKATGIRVGYRRTGMYYAAVDADQEARLCEKRKWQKPLPVRVSLKTEPQMARCFPMLGRIRAALYYPDAGRIYAESLMRAMKAYARTLGIPFLRSSRRPRVLSEKGKTFRIQCGTRSLRVPVVVNAAGSWAAGAVDAIRGIPVRPLRGQICIARGRPGLDAIVHSLGDHYIVPWENGRYLLGSTVEDAGFRPRPTKQGRDAIVKNLQRLFPSLKHMRLIRSWAGLRPYCADGLPLVGSCPGRPGLFLATGYFRSGILLGSYLGDLLAEAILNGTIAPELRPLNPGRLRMAG